GGTIEKVEEITLDVFLTLWKNTSKLDTNSIMSAYIAGITKNLIKLKYRKIKFLDNIDDYEDKIVDLSNIEMVLSNNEKYMIIMEELRNLKSEDKEVFISYYNNEIKIKDLSKIYNMSESKIKSKLYRVRKKLNKKLKERGYGINE
ncbi:MAG: sigma-70 family RNA polymerase sigma factor, partial [Clostridia bacterium]|nr:sigma-70 family RNA polymerase sigma factor [Clostridia bacterium]